MNVNRYQFDSIVQKTKRDITPIMRGEEDGFYFEYLALLEIAVHEFHLKFGINGRQAKEIIQLILFDIKSVVDGQNYDCTKWEEGCYRACADVIEEYFMPHKNAELQKELKEGVSLDDDYFEFARKNLIRIHESVELWTKDFGSNGYFNFISGFVGDEIQTSKSFLVEDRFLIRGQ